MLFASLPRKTRLAGQAVFLALLVGCVRAPDMNKMKCTTVCPSGYQCRVAGAVKRCCRPTDTTCGAGDASSSDTNIQSGFDSNGSDKEPIAALDGVPSVEAGDARGGNVDGVTDTGISPRLEAGQGEGGVVGLDGPAGSGGASGADGAGSSTNDGAVDIPQGPSPDGSTRDVPGADSNLSGPDSACSGICTLGSKRCGVGGGVQACVSGGSCVAWSVETRCEGNQVCAGNEPNAQCQCPPPPASCAGKGTFCSGQILQICNQDAQGCISLAAPIACPSETPCTGDFPNASCSCPTAPSICGNTIGTFCASPTGA